MMLLCKTGEEYEAEMQLILTDVSYKLLLQCAWMQIPLLTSVLCISCIHIQLYTIMFAYGLLQLTNKLFISCILISGSNSSSSVTVTPASCSLCRSCCESCRYTSPLSQCYNRRSYLDMPLYIAWRSMLA